MSLELRGRCERCDAVLAVDGDALICSYECTFCPACGAALGHSCPNCGGELVRRPRRRSVDVCPTGPDSILHAQRPATA